MTENSVINNSIFFLHKSFIREMFRSRIIPCLNENPNSINVI